MIIETIKLISNYIFAAGMPFSHIIGYAACAIVLFCSWKNLKELSLEPFFASLIIFVLYGFIRNMFCINPKDGYVVMLGYLSHWIMPFILGYSLKKEENIKQVFYVFLGVFFLIISLSIAAYLNLFIKQVGHHNYLVHDGLLKGLRSHIALASICLLFSAISLSQIAFRIRELPLSEKILYSFFVIFFGAALFLTGSRGYYIAAIAVYSLFAIVWLAHTGKVKFIFTAAAVLGLIVSVLYMANPALKNRIKKTDKNDNNVKERVMLYKIALQEIKDRPFFGFGPGQGIKQKEYANILPENMRNVMRHPHLHSFYLNLAADFGLTGLVLFFCIIFFALRKLWKAAHRNNGFSSALAYGVFFGFCGLLIGDCFDTLLRGPGVAMEMFWLIGILF